ncbi:MAG: Fe-S cluster assembly ATPase SufC [Gammaproteobacteria bacterium]|nr:MAG: Fe-S cluster assembly ATPase SufC [Gammaproteobacteria bacterium]
MLSVRNLVAEVGGKTILNGISLDVKPGEVHAIMGPNGSGKSTLANVLAGRPGYQVVSGEVIYNDKDLLELEPETRACEGVFLAFQYPVEIPGVSNMQFLKASVDAVRSHQGKPELQTPEFMKLAREKCTELSLKPAFLKRGVNEGFSGGEKKRNEILQMALLEPSLCLLDETDSGLDIDALQIAAQGVNSLRDTNRSFVLVTHYQRLLEYIVPDYVHVLAHGKIVKSGGRELALELEANGYSWIEEQAG